MRRLIAACIISALLLQIGAASVLAQRYARRNGPAMTVYGPVYNPTMSPEYRLWANNPGAYEQLMMQRRALWLQQQQKAAAKQQQALVKQRQAFEKWLKEQKKRKDEGKATDPAFDRYMSMNEAAAKNAAGGRRTSARRQSGRRQAAAGTADPTVAPGGGPRPPETKGDEPK